MHGDTLPKAPRGVKRRTLWRMGRGSSMRDDSRTAIDGVEPSRMDVVVRDSGRGERLGSSLA